MNMCVLVCVCVCVCDIPFDLQVNLRGGTVFARCICHFDVDAFQMICRVFSRCLLFHQGAELERCREPAIFPSLLGQSAIRGSFATTWLASGNCLRDGSGRLFWLARISPVFCSYKWIRTSKVP